jgi:hypothetical protein
MKHPETAITLEGLKALLPFAMIIITLAGVYWQLQLGQATITANQQVMQVKLDAVIKAVEEGNKTSAVDRKEMTFAKDNLINRISALEYCTRAICK